MNFLNEIKECNEIDLKPNKRKSFIDENALKYINHDIDLNQNKKKRFIDKLSIETPQLTQNNQNSKNIDSINKEFAPISFDNKIKIYSFSHDDLQIEDFQLENGKKEALSPSIGTLSITQPKKIRKKASTYLIEDDSFVSNSKVSKNEKIDIQEAEIFHPKLPIKKDFSISDDLFALKIPDKIKKFGLENEINSHIDCIQDKTFSLYESNETIDELSLKNAFILKHQNASLKRGTEWLQQSVIQADTTSTTTFIEPANDESESLSTHINIKKLVKNGFANQLKKILERNRSEVNFMTHKLNKNDANFMDKCVCIKPIKKAIIFSYMFIIYGTDINTNDRVAIVLNISTIRIDTFNSLNENSSIKLYPPWRRLLLPDYQINVYFSASLVKTELSIYPSKPVKKNLTIINNTITSDTNVFDFNRIMQLAKINKKQKITNDMFNTQNSTQTQEARLSSTILDSLEEEGYFGKISFIGTIQRVFYDICKDGSIIKYALVTDKLNIFAQIRIPENFKIEESFRYDFKSLKFIEKLSFEKGSSISKQVEFIWSKLKDLSLKTPPDHLFSFEYIEYLSEIDKLDKSRNYTLLATYDTLRQVETEEYFILNSCVLLTIEIKKDYNQQNIIYEIYIADDLQHIHKIIFKNLSIIDSSVLEEATNSKISLVTLKNVSLVKNQIQLNQFSYIEKSLIEQLIPIDTLFRPLDNLFHLNDFVRINGRVLSVLKYDKQTELEVSLSVKEVKQIVKIRLNKQEPSNLIADMNLGPLLGFIYELNKNIIFIKELYYYNS